MYTPEVQDGYPKITIFSAGVICIAPLGVGRRNRWRVGRSVVPSRQTENATEPVVVLYHDGKNPANTCDVETTVNNGMNYEPQLVQNFFHEKYRLKMAEWMTIFWKPDMFWWWSIESIQLNVMGLYVLSGIKSLQYDWTGNPVYWVYVSIVLWRIHPESTIFEPKTVDSWILRSGKLT